MNDHQMATKQGWDKAIGKPRPMMAAITADTVKDGQEWCTLIDEALYAFKGLVEIQGGTIRNQDAMVDLFQAYTVFKYQFVLNYDQADLQKKFNMAIDAIENKLTSPEPAYAQYKVHSKMMVAIKNKFPNNYEGKQKIWKQLCSQILVDKAAYVKSGLKRDATNMKQVADVKRDLP
ncbi:unnamed protein product [Tilletia controversa]|nr:unnamed protein product [Tilletia controversa]